MANEDQRDIALGLLSQTVSSPSPREVSGVLLLNDQEDEDTRSSELLDKSSKATPKTPNLQHLLWEIFSLVLATLCLVALVALLYKYNNRENPQWSLDHVGITLNAIVSIISTTFRASLLMPVGQSIAQFGWIWYTQPRPLRDICYYHAASRGPLGSISLLFKLRFM